VHGDLKSANVLLKSCTTPGFFPRFVPVLSDFGLARLDGATTRTNTVAQASCTMPWRAPEVARGGRATIESDVWSLGMVFLELVTRRRPFVGKDDQQILEILKDRANKSLWPHAPADLDAALAPLGKLMEDCWAEKECRPQASLLRIRLKDMQANMGPTPASPRRAGAASAAKDDGSPPPPAAGGCCSIQ
jgi:serine/threonine protein kinase